MVCDEARDDVLDGAVGVGPATRGALPELRDREGLLDGEVVEDVQRDVGGWGRPEVEALAEVATSMQTRIRRRSSQARASRGRWARSTGHDDAESPVLTERNTLTYSRSSS